MITVHAHAKINLSLEILGRRSDGYHELISVMQTISLHDELSFAPAKSVELTCSDPTLQTEDNLVFRGARMLQERYKVPCGCRVSLDKRVPAAAGLGGGSSDAAAALTALSRLWTLDLTCADLLPLAAELGSDVPFFLYGGTALVRGRGERIYPLPSAEEAWYVLTRPEIAVLTAHVFRNLLPSSWTTGEATRALAAEIEQGGRPAPGRNSLQNTLFRLYPAAHWCYEDVLRLAGNALISGSGPTVLAMCEGPEEAEHVAQSLQALGYWSTAARSWLPDEELTPCA